MKLFSGQQERKRSYSLAAIGVPCLTVGILILLLNPIELIVDMKLGMKEGSMLFRLWEKPPLDVFVSVFVFNITNFDRFMSGLDPKLKLEEIGPYVYQEFLENTNATINANNTITFRPRRTVKFIPEKSVGDPKKHVVTVPNVPYMGVTTAASKLSVVAAMAVRTLMSTMKSELIFNMTVHDYLWGYDDPLVRLASKLIPGVIHFETFGLLDRMFDEGENVVTINLPSGKRNQPENVLPVPEAQVALPEEDLVSKDKDTYAKILNDILGRKDEEKEQVMEYQPNVRDFSIDSWNGKTGLSFWGYKEGSSKNTECNTLRGTYDGTLFPRNITKGERFRVYRKNFCRTLAIEYSHPGTMNGIDAYFFKLADNAFDSDMDDPASSCFCTDNVCLKKGLGNITPCYYNIPAAISFPHFFNADPSLLSSVDGLSPSEEKHGTEIVLQPQLGVPMKVHSRFQLNLLMGEVKFNKAMTKFKNTVLPIIWLEIAIENLTPDLLFLLKLLFNVAPYIQISIMYLLILVGMSFMGFAGLIFLCAPKTTGEFLPKNKMKYFSIYSYIKNEMDKVPVEEEEESCLASA